MKYSGIGGQAVLEGIMMRNGNKYAVAVRKPDGEIALEVNEIHSWSEKHKWMAWPFIRGTFNFIESLKVGISTLMFSAKFFEDEEEESKAKSEEKLESEATESEGEDEEKPAEKSKKETAKEAAFMTFTLILSLCFAIGLFALLPTFIASLFNIENYLLKALVEGVIRILIFIGYVWIVSFMKDIKRTYMYHGSEHKCINCIEHGLDLTVENVAKSSKEHKRCGTSFLLIVMVISIFVFMFIHIDNIFLRMLSRILLLPVVAGLSYEFLRLAGRYDNWFLNALSRPGMWLQGLTTKEPTDDMIEVAITAVEAVFDWKKFQETLDDDNISAKGCCK